MNAEYSAASTLFQIVVDGGGEYPVGIAKTSSDKGSFVKRISAPSSISAASSQARRLWSVLNQDGLGVDLRRDRMVVAVVG